MSGLPRRGVSPHKQPRTSPTSDGLLLSLSESLLSAEASQVWLRLIQYSLRFSVHLSRGSRRLTPTLNRVLGLIGLLSALRRLVGLSQLGKTFVRSLVAFASPAPSSTPAQWPSTSQFDQIRLLGWAREALDTVALLSDASFLLTSHAVLAPIFRPRRLNPNRLDQLASLSALAAAGVGLWETKALRERTWTQGRAIRREARAIEVKLESGGLWTGDEHDEAQRRDESRMREVVKVHQRQLRGLRAELVDLDWERVRLGAEAIFAVWDVLELKWAHEAVKSYAGLTAAFIATRQAIYGPGAAALSPTGP